MCMVFRSMLVVGFISEVFMVDYFSSGDFWVPFWAGFFLASVVWFFFSVK